MARSAVVRVVGMPVPDFVATLRSAVGHDPLLLPGVTAVVRNERGEVLLGLRSDNGRWALVSGILEPGEQPAEAVVREIREETGVDAQVLGLTSTSMTPPVTYPNGDVAQYLDLCFLCRHVAGEPHVADDESLEVGWFAPDALPEDVTESSRRKLALALEFDGRTRFVGDGPEQVTTPPPLGALRLTGRDLPLRRARATDVAAIVALVADDPIAAGREQAGDHPAYEQAFAAVDRDPHQLLVVAEDDGDVAATLQLTFIPGLSRGGAWRAQIEAVRVAPDLRGHGVGSQLIAWAVDEARRRGCSLVQLTTDKRRADAHRFYERWGFTRSHEGFKLVLGGTDATGPSEEHR